MTNIFNPYIFILYSSNPSSLFYSLNFSHTTFRSFKESFVEIEKTKSKSICLLDMLFFLKRKDIKRFNIYEI